MKKNKKYYLYQMNANIISIVSLLILVLLILLACLTTLNLVIDSISYLVNMNLFLFLIVFFSYLFLHEILHSIAYVLYGGNFNKIIYGISLEKGVLYCLCKQNITKYNILHSLMYPLFFIGVLTYIISVIFNLPLLFILSIFNLSGCSGDIVMFIFISKFDKNINFTELDDEMSFAIYTDKDISNTKHFGLDYLGVKDDVSRKDLKKIKISKPSIIIIIVLVIVSLLPLIL